MTQGKFREHCIYMAMKLSGVLRFLEETDFSNENRRIESAKEIKSVMKRLRVMSEDNDYLPEKKWSETDLIKHIHNLSTLNFYVANSKNIPTNHVKRLANGLHAVKSIMESLLEAEYDKIEKAGLMVINGGEMLDMIEESCSNKNECTVNNLSFSDAEDFYAVSRKGDYLLTASFVFETIGGDIMQMHSGDSVYASFSSVEDGNFIDEIYALFLNAEDQYIERGLFNCKLVDIYLEARKCRQVCKTYGRYKLSKYETKLMAKYIEINSGIIST